MAARDPSTGQFVSAADMDRFDDIEVVTLQAATGVAAVNLDGGTTFSGGDFANFEGLELLDYDDLIDRAERAVLLRADHRLSVYQNSTATADGTVTGIAEVSSSPARSSDRLLPGSLIDDQNGGSSVLTPRQDRDDDSIDLVGRYLLAVGHAPFSDGVTGVGGGGSAGEDSYTVQNLPEEVAEFHPRDELFLNGAFDTWNISDAGVHMDFAGQHIYGIVEE